VKSPVLDSYEGAETPDRREIFRMKPAADKDRQNGIAEDILTSRQRYSRATSLDMLKVPAFDFVTHPSSCG